MKTRNKIIILVSIIIISIVGYLYFTFNKRSFLEKEIKLTVLAKCLKDKGALFYGTYWCLHCSEQKGMFIGNSIQSLPYVECSTSDGQRQLEVCTNAKIDRYPTWVFADGSRQSGTITLLQLAEKTGCQLP